MQRIYFAGSVFVVFTLLIGGPSRCAASDQETLLVRDGKKLICTVLFQDSLDVDCGTESYDAVFTAKILAVSQVHHRSGGQHVADSLGASPASDLHLTVEPEEVFKGHPVRGVQIFAEQGECFAEVHGGDEWLFFGHKRSASTLEISYHLSNPSGPVEQRREYVERLRRLAHRDGLSFVAGEVNFPSEDSRKENISNPRPNHRLLMTSKDGRSYSGATDAQGKFQFGPVVPGFYEIDANTDSQFRDLSEGFDGAVETEANGCRLARIELEINSEISGRVILPEGYKYKKSEIENFFPLFYVDVDTLDGKQAGGTSIGDGLRFAVKGLPPGSYIVQLVNFCNETWLRKPVFAPGVTDRSAAVRVDLGWAEKRTGLEIPVPPQALKRVH